MMYEKNWEKRRDDIQEPILKLVPDLQKHSIEYINNLTNERIIFSYLHDEIYVTGLCCHINAKDMTNFNTFGHLVDTKLIRCFSGACATLEQILPELENIANVFAMEKLAGKKEVNYLLKCLNGV